MRPTESTPAAGDPLALLAQLNREAIRKRIAKLRNELASLSILDRALAARAGEPKTPKTRRTKSRPRQARTATTR